MALLEIGLIHSFELLVVSRVEQLETLVDITWGKFIKILWILEGSLLTVLIQDAKQK
jgi:hypothetical protein